MMGEVRERFFAFVKRRASCVLARRMLREQAGATTIEFGMVALPFLAMVFAIMETAMVFFAGQALDAAGADSARLIMTGQAQNFEQADFKNAVCAKIYALFNCAGGLKIDVKKYTAFDTINVSKPSYDASGALDTSAFGYQKSVGGDIVVV